MLANYYTSLKEQFDPSKQLSALKALSVAGEQVINLQ